MKFAKIFSAAVAMFASVGAMAAAATTGGQTGVGTPVDDLALLGLAVAALAAGVGVIRRKK